MDFFGGLVIFEVLFHFAFRRRRKSRVVTCFNFRLFFVCFFSWLVGFCFVLF